jgi:putative FmdB family regulatory protein
MLRDLLHDPVVDGSDLMPIYEFHCDHCGKSFELLCRMGEDESKIECPNCGSCGVKRLVSRFSAHGVKGGSKSCSPSCSGTCSTCGS